MKNIIYQNKCTKILAEKNITGEDLFNLVNVGLTSISLSTTLKKFEDCGLNPLFFRDYFIKTSRARTKEEQEEIEEQFEYELVKTSKWKFK